MAPLSFTFVRSKYHNPLAVGTAHHRIEVELQSMRASSWRVHASGIEQNISSRNELAHNRTIHSKRGGPYLPLSPPRPVIISSFLPASFIKRCLASCIGPYLRFAESFHAQYTNPLSNESTPSSNREKPFRKKSCRRMIIWSRFTIFPNRSMNDRWYHLSEYYFSFEDETISRNPNIDAILFLFLHNSSNDKIYAQNSKSS